ncbi:AAA domain-containing protein [Fictibacillus nanhaiensis]|uniref:AAA domain-containing protein n=1 Tax=Fictibacillus nanhaiensis TaxID=742169 RepID=UPI00203D0DDC|nr:AAA domain-containing protein [Fictibacillus nanhaiensis]MCM3733188.1 AAA domain-containing protein [Fictibacillus nanhaiensis]
MDFEFYIKLVFKSGFSKIYSKSEIIIEDSRLTNKDANLCFEYLKTLANVVSVDEDLKGKISFLSKQYSKLTTISPRSVLSVYLEKKSTNKGDKLTHPIFPFGFNLSQKLATENALAKQISIIEGPPGTGKTQTILNIIANAVINDKTVAVVSNNNSATANVFEKLQKYNVDFIAAYLGNKENQSKFFAEQNEIFPNMNNWVLAKTDQQTIKKQLIESQQKLNEMLGYQNEQAVLKHKISNLQTEFEYFNKYYTESNYKSFNLNSFSRISSDKILKILLNYKRIAVKGKIPLRNKLYNLLAYGIYNFKIYNFSPEVVVSLLQRTYYITKINEMQIQIDILSEKLNNYNFEREIKEFSSKSMELFKAKLAEKCNYLNRRKIFTDEALWKNKEFKSFIKEYPVILSTTHSLRNCAVNNYLFDYVIIDESSQVDLVTGALALSSAKNAVIVGDVKQLPNVISNEVANTTRRIFDSFELDSAFNYADHSLLSSMLSLFKNIPKTLLKEHYRCHPKIIGFCNQKFYNNELIILTNAEQTLKPLTIYKTVKGNHARGKVNQRQIDVVFNEIIPEQKLNNEKKSVGIISPFRLQADELKKVIKGNNIDSDTVHKYQGQERDIIILTTVANEIKINDFVDNPNLINVAVSRAVEKLVIVVSEGSDKWEGTHIGDLIKYIKYNNFEIIESQIYSVFDLLYSSYSEKLLDIMVSSRNVSAYKSENLMNAVIEKVLSMPEFKNLNHILHQPLRMLIKNHYKLTEEERKYASNILTHTDFVIFNKLDKSPVLVVEVDGHEYHANNPTQLKRDKLKDGILEKYGIPIIRMKTTGSEEERRLRQKLLHILNVSREV